MDKNISQFKLQNGLRVFHIPNSSETLSFSFRIAGGAIHEKDNEIGCAHFLEHITLDATKNYPNVQLLSGLIEDVGGIRNGFTSRETIQYCAKVLDKDVERGFIFLSEVVLRPLFLDKSIRKHKKIITQEINRFKSDPEKYVPRLAPMSLYGNQRIGRFVTGDIEDVEKITSDSIQKFHDRTHVARNSVLVVCGGTETEVFNLSLKYFASMPEGKELPLVPANLSADIKPIIETRSGVKQVEILLSYPTYLFDDEKKYAAFFLAGLLGRGKASRLFDQIREKNALSYSLSVNNTCGQSYAYLSIEAGVAPDKVKEFISIIKSELKKLLEAGFTDEEKRRVNNLFRARQIFNLEDSLEKAKYYSERYLFGWSDTAEKEIDKIENLSHEQVMAAASEIFSKEPRIVAVGDASQVEFD